MTVAINEVKENELVEVWKDVVNYKGLYQVSNLGNVRNHKKNEYLVFGSVSKNLKPRIDKYGYKQVRLSGYGKTKNKLVSRLVLMAFVPNPDNKPECNHIDGNKENNNVTNLEWSTRLENMQHAWRIGLMHPEKSNKKVSMVSVILGTTIATFESMTRAEQISGIDKTSIGRVCNGKAHTAGGYKWVLA